ncbi:MAG: RNA-directed DNA polymerase [Candidimonas sp.]|nr:MAG: RNA-directed DNA polymerase [Candidimonas sp.]TAM23729.1 MAG: RNA-directed DNA polymerase [Candidimonas sp.]
MDPGYALTKLVRAYYDCRRHKRNSESALQFEMNLEDNLRELDAELQAGTYRPGQFQVTVITRPRPREVWASEFRDRVVHHLLHNEISERFEKSFIANSCACIPGRGPSYAAQRVDSCARSITQNWSTPAHYIKMDLANFFVSIDKRVVWPLLAAKITDPWWRNLAYLILFHDPRTNYIICCPERLLKLVPKHKSLFGKPAHMGLAIGNLPSQFDANVLLNVLDQFVKHQIGARYYVRYVDDFVLLHKSVQFLNDAHDRIEELLRTLGLALNEHKTIRQPVERGIDFAGHVIKPWRRETRRRTVHTALARIQAAPPGDVYAMTNSYLGLLRQTSSHHDRALIANAARRRGHCVDASLTKIFQHTA